MGRYGWRGRESRGEKLNCTFWILTTLTDSMQAKESHGHIASVSRCTYRWAGSYISVECFICLSFAWAQDPTVSQYLPPNALQLYIHIYVIELTGMSQKDKTHNKNKKKTKKTNLRKVLKEHSKQKQKIFLYFPILAHSHPYIFLL